MNGDPSSPKISIVIPVFNASGQIEDCLRHVFASSFKDFEVVLVEDGSTDDSLKKGSSFPCRILIHPINKGAAASRNHGIEEAQGRIVLLIDSDVLIPPNLLARVWSFFEKYPDVSILQARYEDTPYYQNLLSQYKHYVFSFRGQTAGSDYINYIHTACVAVRKNVFQKFRFNENLKRREDVEFGLRISEEGLLIRIDPALTVGHKKKYGFLSFSKYQFRSAKELVLQSLVTKNKNLAREVSSRKSPAYKKMWLLRPIVCFLFLADFVWLARGGGFFASLLLVFILASSFLLEYRFRLYLFRVAPLKVFLAAFLLYFYDGLLTGLGVAAGICQAVKKVPFGGRRRTFSSRPL